MARGDSFFDFFGLKRNVRPTETAGEPGTAVYGGYPIEIEKNRDLIGTKKYVTYSELMANTTIAAAGIRLFLNLVSKSKWKAEPADMNNAAAVEAAEFIQDVMDQTETPWHRIIRRAAMYRFYGFSIQEWTAVRREDDGRLGILDIAPRPQTTIERWDCDNPQGKVQGVVQRSRQTSDEIYLPRNKIIYVVDDAISDSPEGLGLLRHVIDASDRLKRYELLEAYGFEIDLRGIPVGRAPIAMIQDQIKKNLITPEEGENRLAPMKNFLARHIKNPKLAMLLDSTPYRGTGDQMTPSGTPQWDVSLLQGDSNGAEPINMAIERTNREIARLLGVEFLMLGTTGSQALSRDKTATFNTNVESALDEVRETYRRDFMERTLELNGFPEDVWPTLTTETVQFREIEEITSALKDLSSAMLTPGDPATNEVREIIGLSPIPEELEEALLEERQSRLEAETFVTDRDAPGNNNGNGNEDEDEDE